MGEIGLLRAEAGVPPNKGNQESPGLLVEGVRACISSSEVSQVSSVLGVAVAQTSILVEAKVAWVDRAPATAQPKQTLKRRCQASAVVVGAGAMTA
jgi:hypothetical protein